MFVICEGKGKMLKGRGGTETVLAHSHIHTHQTVQTLALLLRLKDQGHFTASGPALLVVPTSLIHNWQSETKKFAPSLRILVFHGSARKLPTSGSHSSSSSGHTAGSAKRRRTEVALDYVLTTYGTLRTDLTLLKKQLLN